MERKKYDYNYSSMQLKGEYEYLFGEKNGKAIKYFENGKIKFEGEYLNGSKWKGKCYNPDGYLLSEIENGKVKEEKNDSKGESSEQSREILFFFEQGNEEQKNYCLELARNYSHMKGIRYRIYCYDNSTFLVLLILNGNVYHIRNTFNENEMELILLKMYLLIDEEE